ncbi:hypothetical protein J8F10_25490 [Gemmata sp. G18]|uniref:DUF104 domain-containing protein n=1 Tax=Gemmata palustris TaxID=2822762 RepID=A0ABS5BXZ4_9BACT|nr:hypothetical protein [Gemmata palustris]MBP3958615.1 hypothetical protein [Gemmata palustris]
MSTIHGTIRGGKVVFDTPPDLPDGTRVVVDLVAPSVEESLPDDDGNSPEAIEKRLALMDQFQAWMTPEEFAEWEKMRAEDKAFQLSQWEKWNQEAAESWE